MTTSRAQTWERSVLLVPDPITPNDFLDQEHASYTAQTDTGGTD